MNIRINRIYEDDDSSEGHRILVDRLWPRGVSKNEANLDDWWKDLAPSGELRKWFDHDPEKWPDFKNKYRKELDEKRSLLKEKMDALDLRKTITLLYGARDKDHNQAVVLKGYMEDRL